MKKILLTLVAVVALTSVASAQTQWTIGGVATFTSDKAHKDADATNKWSVMPKATYNFNETWGVGLGIGIAGTKDYVTVGAVTSEVTATTFTVQPSLTYTLDLGGNFYYTPDFYVGYSSYSVKDADVTPAIFTVGLNFGSFEFKPVEWMGITLSCGNISYAFANEDGGEGSGFNFGANSGQWSAGTFAPAAFAPAIGVRIHF